MGKDLKELIKTGPVALLVAFAGVIVSVAGGAAVYLVFGFGDGDLAMLEAVFMGTILAATSVSITVQALKEMGHLKGRVATTILSAAIGRRWLSRRRFSLPDRMSFCLSSCSTPLFGYPKQGGKR